MLPCEPELVRDKNSADTVDVSVFGEGEQFGGASVSFSEESDPNSVPILSYVGMGRGNDGGGSRGFSTRLRAK